MKKCVVVCLALAVLLCGCAMLAGGLDLEPLFAAEPAHTVDVLVLGSSLSATGIDPVQMFRQHGFTGYVLSCDAPDSAYRTVLAALKHQSPRVLVLEVNLFLQPADTQAAAALYSSNVPEGHQRAAQPAIAKGFTPLYLVQSFHTPAVLAEQPLPDLPKACQSHLEKFFALSEETGIPLAFTVFPGAGLTEEERRLLTAFADTCTQRGATVVDLTRTDTQYTVRFDFAADMADSRHLNYRGAGKLTGLLGQNLQTAYALPDHTGEAGWANWEQAVRLRAADEQDALVYIAATPAELLERTRDKRYITFISATGDMTAGDPGELSGLFREMHISSEVFAEKAANRLWVWWENAVHETDRFTLQSDAGPIVALPGSVTGPELAQQTAGAGISAVVLEKSTGRLIRTFTWRADRNYALYAE